MTRHRTHQWSTVVDRFRETGIAKPQFAPLADAVARLGESRFAAGLYPVKWNNTLLLYRLSHSEPGDAHLRIDADDGEFVARHLHGTASDPGFTLTSAHGIWTKRGGDPLALLERAFHHIGWFADHRLSVADTVSERSPGR